jgi:hypothetical protein
VSADVHFFCPACDDHVRVAYEAVRINRMELVNAGMGLGDVTDECRTIHEIARHLDLIGDVA